jgi:CDP-diglyceride synthetase
MDPVRAESMVERCCCYYHSDRLKIHPPIRPMIDSYLSKTMTVTILMILIYLVNLVYWTLVLYWSYSNVVPSWMHVAVLVVAVAAAAAVVVVVVADYWWLVKRNAGLIPYEHHLLVTHGRSDVVAVVVVMTIENAVEVADHGGNGDRVDSVGLVAIVVVVVVVVLHEQIQHSLLQYLS